MNSPNSEFRRLVKPICLFLGLLLLVPLIGFSVVHLNEPKIRESAYENLNSIAKLRATEIENWLDERESNLKLLAAGEGFVFNAKRFVQTGNADSRAFVVRRLEAYSKARYYQSSLLLNANGEAMAAAGKPADTTAPIFQSLIQSAMKSGHVEHSVLYRDAITKNIHLDFVLPLPGTEGQPASALVLLNAPADDFLFPLIQTWPSSSPSSETLLVRRDGTDALFLNELRHRKGTALSLRIPLSETNVPAVAAVLSGRAITMEGCDYRGITVFSASQPIAGTSWHVVAKIDREEAMAPLKTIVLWVSLVTLGALIIIAMVIWRLWRQMLLTQRLESTVESTKSLLESEAKYRRLYESMADAYVMVDMTGHIINFNSAYREMLRYSDEELRNLTYVDLTPDKWHGGEAQIVTEQVVPLGQSDVYEKEYIRKDGTVFPVELRTFLLRDANDQPEAMWAIVRDISERIWTEKVQRFLAHTASGMMAEEPFFRALARYLAENLGMDFVCFDRLEGDGLTARTLAVWCDGQFEDNVTYALKDTPCGVLASKSICCFPSDVCQQFPHDQVLKDLQAESYVGVTLFSHTGLPIGLIAVIGRQPLTSQSMAESILKLVSVRAASELEQIQAEESLRESRELFKSLNDNLSVGVLMVAPDMTVIAANPRILDFFPGFDATMNPPCYGVLNSPTKSEPCTECPVIKTFRDGGRHIAEREVSTSAGMRIFSMHSSAIIDRNGNVTAAIEIIDDITERKELESQLQQAQKMEAVGRLAGDVAHDFNNMLTIIIGHAELALMNIDPSQPLHEHLVLIQNAAIKSADLTRQLLAFARKQTIAPIVLDLNEAVSSMSKMLQRLIGDDVYLAWRPGADIRQVKVDPSQIDQILANLCVNARDAITNVGTITIETENCAIDADYPAVHMDAVPGEYVRLSVSDDGCGMNKETLRHIFEPFFTTKAVGVGTGLGLATVYGIVKQNDGFINVYSEPGIGTTFNIYFHRHIGKDGQMLSEGARDLPPRGQETILVAEDETVILKMTSMLLSRQGYTVLAANSPSEAIKIAREYAGEIHLLITDVIMPEMNGRDLAKELQSLSPSLKCLFMSGYTADVIAQHGVLDEGIYFIQKPFSLPGLATKVREVLDGK